MYNYTSSQELRDLAAQGRPENPAVQKMLDAADTIEDLERQFMDAQRVIQELRSQPVHDESTDVPAQAPTALAGQFGGEAFDLVLIERADARLNAISSAVEDHIAGVKQDAASRIDEVAAEVARSVAADVQARLAGMFTAAPSAPLPATAGVASSAPASEPMVLERASMQPATPPSDTPRASASTMAPQASTKSLGSLLGATSPAVAAHGDTSVLADLLEGYAIAPAPSAGVATLEAPARTEPASSRPEAPQRPSAVSINAPMARPNGEQPMPWA